MCQKIIIITISLLLAFNVTYSQLAYFSFDNTPYTEPSFNNTNINVTNFALSLGTVGTNKMTGTYFTNEPYISGTGGWNKTTADEAKYFYVTITAKANQQFILDTILFEAYATGAGPSAIDVFINDNPIYSTNIASSSLQNIEIPLTGYENLTTVTIKIAGWDNGSRTTSGSGGLKLDEVSIKGTTLPLVTVLNDSNSVITATDFVIPTSISSMQNTENSIKVLEFIVADSASVDNVSTIIKSLEFVAGDFNQVNLWTDVIAGTSLYSRKNREFNSGIVNNRSLVFDFSSGLEIHPSVLQADTLELYIWLKENIGNNAGKQFDFLLDSSLIVSDAIGSKVGNGKLYSGKNVLKLEVDATVIKAVFSSNTFTDSIFSLGVYAVDANGNVDTDYNGVVNIEFDYTQGVFQPASELIGNMINGFYQFDNLRYTGADTVNFTITANSLTDYSGELLIGKNFFLDDFNGNNLTQWHNVNSWTIENNWLKHNLVDSAASSYISAEYVNTDFNTGVTSWNMELRNGDFNPSSANKFWYYLMSSNSNLLSDQNDGYAIGVNMVGSTDSLSLWKVDKGEKKLLIRTTLAWDNQTTSSIKIIRSGVGSWKIGFDNIQPYSSMTYSESCVDNTFNNLAYHGLVYVNTRTNAGKLYLNNLEVMQLNSAPEIISVRAISIDSVLVVFSEDIDVVSAKNLVNYSLTDGVGNIISIESVYVNSSATDSVILKVESLNTQEYLLHISGVKDLQEEPMKEQTIEFKYREQLALGSIVISEILADESPVIGLPEDEFIEIYNTTNAAIHLGNIYLQVNKTKKKLPSYNLNPNQYLILCSTGAYSDFATLGNTLIVPSFPSLTNLRAAVSLIDSLGNIINKVEYNTSWYGNEDKASGGWSLEKIDLANNCGGIKNWTASVNDLGGTPGKENSVKAVNVDDVLPKINQIIPTGETQLLLVFSESIDAVLAQQKLNYQILGLGNPQSTKLVGNLVYINFVKPIKKGDNELKIQNITDLCGNTVLNNVYRFNFYLPKLYDVVFNEIMEDSDPSIGLPNADYIELYNRTDFGFFLYSWKLKIGRSEKVLETTYMPAHSYLIVCSQNDTNLFNPYGNVASIKGNLNLSSSAWLGLLNVKSDLMSAVNYSSSWIIDDFKQEGGFSLERIDFNNLIDNESNWVETQNIQGGTPGKKNSVYRENPDYLAANVLRVMPISANRLRVDFDKSIKMDNLNKQAFIVDKGMGNPESVSYDNTDLTSLYLNYSNAFSSGILYELKIDNTITDVLGNELERNYAQFMLPNEALPFDVVINEVLFNPKSKGVDFIELYNRSSQPINLKQFTIASRDEDGHIKNNKRTSEKGALILPSEYLVLSTNSAIIKQQYLTKNSFAFYDVKYLPSMPNDKGVVVLLDTLGSVIDEFSYSDKMHFALLNNTRGISLERINYNTSTSDLTNWHSAAESVGWATPGYKNSVFDEEYDSNSLFELEPEAFSPDNDGFDDQLNIHYKVDAAGWVASITILQSNGKRVRKLVQNELLEMEGSFAWNGLDDDMQLVPIGIYIVFFEYYNLDGKLKKYYKPCVVSTKF